MTEIHEKAYAKLNISLDVSGSRDDGYHNMVMVMQTISLSDDVDIELNDSGRVRARTGLPFIPGDERNLAVKAALRYFSAAGMEGQGALIKLSKNIPVGAGMGGGSADAAAVLRGLDRLFNNRLGVQKLTELASDIGSDVAFCIAGGTALATGRGEKLEALPPMPECSIAVCKPAFSISTPELFKELDRVHLHSHPDTAGIIEALGRGDLPQVCRRMYNVFEDVGDRRMREAAQIKGILLDCGALGAVMTGTGSAVFGVFEKPESAEEACRELKKDYNFCCTAKCVPSLF